MIDPSRITDYTLDTYGLQEHALFWIAVAGKTAVTVAPRLELALADAAAYMPHIMLLTAKPFDMVRTAAGRMDQILKARGIGCWKLKARGMRELANSSLNLRTCTAADLERIYGIGPKTARCFLLHTRQGVRHAGLDTHILKFLREAGHEVPAQTPASPKRYGELEQLFLQLADEAGKTPAEFDLEIWNRYSVKAK